MRICPLCQQQYSDDMDYCSRDATPLPPVTSATEFGLAAGVSRRYRIVRRLGEGGMGTVFLAEQLAVGNRPVALKILRRRLLQDPEFLQRFQDEASSTGRIRHQNVVTVHECGQTDDGSPYIAMEFLDGESLRQYLKREGALPLEMAAEILQQAARGLSAAHKLGIIHRDLKPDNIFLTRDDDGRLLVKIVDFGIAKMRESTTHTMTGLAVGTPTYMSVEQASGMRSEEIDLRSDIYSLGIVAYEMIAGVLPFHADTPLAYVQKHLIEPPAPLSLARPDLHIPPQVEQVVMKALEKNREERYASAPEFARAFAEAATGKAIADTSSDRLPLPPAVVTPVETTPSAQRFPRWLLPASVLFVLLISAGTWYLVNRKPQPKPSTPPEHTVVATVSPAPQTQTAPPQPQTTPPPRPKVPASVSHPVPQPLPSLDHAIDLLKAHNYSAALPIFQQSVAGGDADGERYLADMYRNGWGIPQNYVQARRWYEKAAAAGNISAMTDLGHIYDYGWGVPQDYTQARQWYVRAAASGSAIAMADLGRLYEHAWGVAQDYTQARQWYEKAAALGDSAAMLDLGHMYEHGWGVAQDYAQARQWFEKAAAAGNAKAPADLARLPEHQDQNAPQTPNASPKTLGLLQKARSEWQGGDHSRALADVSSAISDSPSWPAAYLFRADWEFSTGNTKAALNDYNACIERNPRTVNLIAAYRGRAKLKASLGDTKGAEADRDAARKLR